MAMTVIDYNGIRIHNVQLAGVHQSIEYDASHTDQLFVRTQIMARGVVFAAEPKDWTRPNVTEIPTNQPLEQSPVVQRPPLTRRTPPEVTAYLSKPRCELRIMMIGLGGPEVTLWHVLPAQEGPNHATNTDVNNGPRPLSVNIVNVTKWGYEIEFQIEFALQPRTVQEIYADGQANDWAINNRWRVREAMDQNFFMTKTYEGTIRITQANADYQFAARWLAFPQLEPGFRRDLCEYTVSADGLEIQYIINDQQEAHAPPWPCTKMEVTHSETLAKYGYYVQSACQVRLYGPPGIPKAILLARLAQILRNRLLWDGQFGKSAFLEALRIVDTIGEDNTVFGEMIINRFPLAAEAEKGGAADPGAAAADVAAALIGGATGALGAAVARALFGGKAKDNAGGNVQGPAVPNDWFEKLTRNVLGTDLNLPPLNRGNLPGAIGGFLAESTYGKEFQNYWQHMRPLPTGYTVFNAYRRPAVSLFFACYYQTPEHMPHEFHPDKDHPDKRQANQDPNANDGPLDPPASRHAGQEAVAPPAEPKEVTRLSGGMGSSDDLDATAPAHAAALYTHATLINDYDFDRGRAVFAKSLVGHYGDPLENDDGESDLEVITVSRPVLIRRVSYDAERIGTWPQIPWPADYDLPNGARAKLLRCRIQPLAPTLAADGVHLVYRVQAQYEWAITRALAGEDLDVAALPHVRSDAVQPFVLAGVASSSLLVNHGRETNVYEDDG